MECIELLIEAYYKSGSTIVHDNGLYNLTEIYT